MLKRLSSLTGLFQEAFEFHPGINLIVGRYSARREPDSSGGVNGIGKSSLIRLIDYLLLSDEAERLFKNKRYQFLREEQHSVQLDIELAGESVSISRCFDPKSAILITRGKQAPNELEKSEARRLLSRLFFPIDKGHALEMERYRSLMTFFIKDDLEAQRRGDPVQYLGHAGANAREMTILNFHLLGLPTRELVDLDRIQTALKAGTDRRSDLVLRIEEMTRKSLAQIRSELSTREKQLKALETALGQYDLMESFQDVSQAIAEHSTKISSLRQEFEQVQRQRLKLTKFVEVNQEIEPREIANQYRQVSSALEQTIRRSLEEVIVFRQSLATERLRFHGKQLQELDLLKLDLLRKLQTHETERAALYRTVDSQGSPSLCAKPLNICRLRRSRLSDSDRPCWTSQKSKEKLTSWKSRSARYRGKLYLHWISPRRWCNDFGRFFWM